MRFVAPRTGAPEQTLAEDQPEYMPITVALYRNSQYPGAVQFLTRPKLTPEEKAAIAADEDIFISQLCFGEPPRFTPLTVNVGMQYWRVDPPIEESTG